MFTRGASRASQVVENVKAIAVAKKLSDDVMARVEVILDNKPEAVVARF